MHGRSRGCGFEDDVAAHVEQYKQASVKGRWRSCYARLGWDGTEVLGYCAAVVF